jgi:ElaA protein
MKDKMEIRIADSAADIAECLRLRDVVFIGEQNVPPDEERDGLDDQCVHFLARQEGEAIGAARLNLLNDGYAKIQRVCVIAAVRGTGAGAAIIRHMIEHVRTATPHKRVRLGAQTHALEFYRKLGFVAFGDEYMDAGIPHFDMEMTL